MNTMPKSVDVGDTLGEIENAKQWRDKLKPSLFVCLTLELYRVFCVMCLCVSLSNVETLIKLKYDG